MSTEDILTEYEEEFMRLAAEGNREAHDFAIGESDMACHSSQAITMGLMKVGADLDDFHAALWVRCARQAFLDVLRKEAAPEWARQEYAKRREESLEMQQEWNESEWPALSGPELSGHRHIYESTENER